MVSLVCLIPCNISTKSIPYFMEDQTDLLLEQIDMYIIYFSCPFTQNSLEHAFTIQLFFQISIQYENHKYVVKK